MPWPRIHHFRKTLPNSPRPLADNCCSPQTQATKKPLLVRTASGKTVVVRLLADDDLSDELIVKHPKFRASIRRTRRARAKGEKGVTLAEARRILGV